MATIGDSLIIIACICLWIDGWRNIFSNDYVGVRDILMILGIFALFSIGKGFEILQQRREAGNPTTTTAVFLTISVVFLTFLPFFW